MSVIAFDIWHFHWFGLKCGCICVCVYVRASFYRFIFVATDKSQKEVLMYSLPAKNNFMHKAFRHAEYVNTDDSLHFALFLNGRRCI